MVALVILAIAIGYLAIAIGATSAAVRVARAKGASRPKQLAYGWAVGLVFFLIPFWDWIPTVAAHRYYCATEAKFEVYKTVEQWKQENVQVFPTLRFDSGAAFVQVGEYERFPLNQRLASERKVQSNLFLNIKREEGRIVDTKNNEILARFVEFRTGYAPLGVGGEGAWKFWLRREACDEGLRSNEGSYIRFKREVQRLGGGEK